MPKLTHMQFCQRLKNLVGTEYTLVSEFTKMSEKIELLHNTCGNSYLVTPEYFTRKNGTRCPKCSTNNKKSSHASFLEFVENNSNNSYQVLGNYINGKTKISLLHKECNTTFNMSPKDFKAGQRCPSCRSNATVTTEIFKKRVEKLTNGEYVVIGEYINSLTPIKLLHKTCNRTFQIPPKRFTGREEHNTAQRCIHCSKESSISKGELRTKIALENRNIDFSQQVHFPDCKMNKFGYMTFDFKIELEDGTFALLEYNGNCHYKPCFGSTRNKRIHALEQQRKRDKYKVNYCKKNNIPLYIIHYKDFENVENLIDEWFL